jgi:hypothetical protein
MAMSFPVELPPPSASRQSDADRPDDAFRRQDHDDDEGDAEPAAEAAARFVENGALELPYLADLGVEPRCQGPETIRLSNFPA